MKLESIAFKSDIVACVLSNWGTPNYCFLQSAKSDQLHLTEIMENWVFAFYFLLNSAIIRMKWHPTIFGFKKSEGNWYQKDLVVKKNSSGIRD